VDIVARSIVAFLFIYFLMRVVGRRELSTLEPFDLILLVVIGDIAQQGITQSDHSFTGLVLSVGTFALLTMALSYLGFRFRRLRPLLEGEPLVVVRDGEVIERNLRRERLTREEVEAEARLQHLDSLDKVKFAVLERGGRISFIPKESVEA
jgi:uncharacterized membrane protein YcaP (DUF421 family)